MKELNLIVKSLMNDIVIERKRLLKETKKETTEEQQKTLKLLEKRKSRIQIKPNNSEKR